MVTPKWYLLLTAIYIVLSYQVPLMDMLLQDSSLLSYLTSEDGFFETIGALAFLITAILFVVALFRSRRPENRATHSLIKQLSYLTLAIVFLFGAGEEISWGQRLFSLATPEALSEINVQGETTIHNINVLGIESGALARRMFNVFWFTFAVIIPVASAVYNPARRWLDKILPVVPWWIGLPFLLNYVLLRALFILLPASYRPYHANIGEIQESNFAVLFIILASYVVFMMLNSSSVKHADNSQSPR